jgi:hypothetical protein
MANETAATYVPLGREGTGYATILQNNILPALQNEQRRADRLYQMEELAKQAAAKAAAKQAEEDARYVPPSFEIAKGDYWNPYIKEQEKTLLAGTLDKIKNARTIGEKGEATNAFNRAMQQINYEGEIDSQKTKAFIPKLQEMGLNVDEKKAAQFYATASQDPNFRGINKQDAFFKWVVTDPNNVNTQYIGQKLQEKIPPNSLTYRNAKGVKEAITISPIYKTKKVYNPDLKANVITAEEVDFDKANALLESNPMEKEVVMAKVNPLSLAIMKKDPTMPQVQAEREAKKLVFEEMFPKENAKVVYDYEEALPPKPGVPKKPIFKTSKGGKSSFIITVKDNNGKVVTSTQNGTWTDPDAVNIQFEKDQVANAGTRAFILSDPTAAKAAGLVEENKQGGYTINQGFNYRLASKKKMPYWSEDVVFTRGGKPVYSVIKDTPIDDVTYQQIKRDPARLKKTKMLTGYEVTANLRYPNYDSEGNPVDSDGKQIKGAALPTLKMFIPEEDATDIITAIGKKGGSREEDATADNINDVWGK